MKKLKPGHDYIGVGGGVLVFNKKKEVLLMKRGKNSKNDVGFWNKIGGEVDWGEKVIDAMKRETREEAGIEIDIWGYLPHTDHIIKKDKQHWIGFNYLADVKSGEAKNMEPHKFDDVKWFSLKKMPKKLALPTTESVNNYLAGKYIRLK
jgi:8-oxo-dGTP diphosphatase